MDGEEVSVLVEEDRMVGEDDAVKKVLLQCSQLRERTWFVETVLILDRAVD